ncbi:uncharacterized protein LOC123474242 [Daphnia magna]|uniref:uncharacterized protein LOC123474242 n=1 Tax=Daphnia magna TaxID=35525 RepID=UPI001E1BDD6F|nr:uncharacterized protein LOC123474242 [Daphnia magna]
MDQLRDLLSGFVIPIARHTGEYLSDCVFKFLETYKINVMDCRGQSYDNASNMSGQYNGLQARIKAVNEKVEYVPCGGHSLNLIASPHRWNILFKALGGKVVLKRLIDVRCSANADAVSALDSGYNEIQSALNLIANDEEEDPKAIIEAKSLSSQMNKLEYVILTPIWNRILSRFNMVRDDFDDCIKKAKEKRLLAEYSFTTQRAKK